ncbi:hypothetical protein ACP70R_044399 [Stipagrostis hirtigluma subsp. patula]
MVTLPTNLRRHYHSRSHIAAVVHLLLLLWVLATTAAAQLVVLPNCNLQEVNLVPCMASGGAGAGVGGGGNISDACCSSLNRAIDAGHRCVCSLLLSNSVFASLVTSLLTLPLVLPLPGCFLYAPSLAACQVTLQQQTHAPPAAISVIGSVGGAAGTVDPPTPQAAVTPPLPSKSGDRDNAGDGRMDASTGNGTARAPTEARQSVSRSNACRSLCNASEGRVYTLTFVALIAVLWFNRVTNS